MADRVPIAMDGQSSERGYYTEDEDLNTDEDFTRRLSLNDYNDELTISGVRRSDASTYSCRAFNTVGAATRTYTLVVQGLSVLYFTR